MKQIMKRFWIGNMVGGCTAIGGAYRKIAVLLTAIRQVCSAIAGIWGGHWGGISDPIYLWATHSP